MQKNLYSFTDGISFIVSLSTVVLSRDRHEKLNMAPHFYVPSLPHNQKNRLKCIGNTVIKLCENPNDVIRREF